MKQISILIAAVACFGMVAVATAQRLPTRDDDFQRQRGDVPPSWSVGNWVGRNDFRKNSVDLQINDDGKCMVTYRVGTNVQTFRGNFRDNRLEFPGERFTIRQVGQDLGLQKDGVRGDYVLLHRIGRPNGGPIGRDDLNLDQPRNNEIIRSRNVVFAGTTSFDAVEVEIFRGRESIRKNRVNANRGRFEIRMNLEPGRYDAAVSNAGRGRNQAERRVSFVVRSGEGRTYIERPAAGEKLDSNFVISGTSEADEVEIEIYRGRDRVFIQRLQVRNDHWETKASLGWGNYVMTVRGKDGSTTLGTDKRGFEVFGRPGEGGGFGFKIDSPSNNGRYGTSVSFDGTTSAREVRIQVYRGRDRVADQTVTVRDGRFRTRIQLSEGKYRANISTVGGRNNDQRDINFEVNR